MKDKNKPHLIMFLAFSSALIAVVVLASCEPVIASSSAKEKQGGEIDIQEAFEAKVAIDTTNMSAEKEHYYESVYNQ
jgi:hypothetical protein